MEMMVEVKFERQVIYYTQEAFDQLRDDVKSYPADLAEKMKRAIYNAKRIRWRE